MLYPPILKYFLHTKTLTAHHKNIIILVYFFPSDRSENLWSQRSSDSTNNLILFEILVEYLTQVVNIRKLIFFYETEFGRKKEEKRTENLAKWQNQKVAQNKVELTWRNHACVVKNVLMINLKTKNKQINTKGKYRGNSI